MRLRLPARCLSAIWSNGYKNAAMALENWSKTWCRQWEILVSEQCQPGLIHAYALDDGFGMDPVLFKISSTWRWKNQVVTGNSELDYHRHRFLRHNELMSEIGNPTECSSHIHRFEWSCLGREHDVSKPHNDICKCSSHDIDAETALVKKLIVLHGRS